MTCVLSLTQMLVFLSLYVILSILIFHIGMCLVSVHVSAPHVIANAHMICIPVSSGKPACHDSSLYLFVEVLFLEAVVLSQVHVALNIFYQQIVYRVLSTTITFVFAMFILRPIRLLSSDSFLASVVVLVVFLCI